MKNLKYNISVDFEVLASSEKEAEQILALELYRMIHKRGLEDIIDYDFIVFIPNEANTYS